jgi:putative ABC transport system permease protein
MRDDDELDKELRFHIESRIADLIGEGLTPAEARRRTRLEFGGVMQTMEAVRDLRFRALVDGFHQDARLAVRSLRTAPIVTAVAILSLALGIGANTAIFSIVDSLVLRALPVANPEQLATVAGGLGPTSTWTYPIWTEIQRRTEAFGGALAWSSLRFNLAQGGEMQPVNGLYVSGAFFTTLGVPPAIGRTFTPADDVRGGGADGAVAIVSYSFWQRHFGGAASAVGSTITIERAPFTIVGVASPAFSGPEVGQAFDVAVPIGTESLVRGKDSTLDNRTNYWLNILIRRKAGQPIEEATAALRAMRPQVLAATVPPNLPTRFQKEFFDRPFSLEPAAGGPSGLRKRYARPLLTILAVVGLVLLIACANIANLQLARTAARRHELSVRAALGASRWRIVRQLLVESILLAAIGAIAGSVLASWASRGLVGLLSSTVNTVFLDLSPDWRVLGFTMIVTVATTVLFGALPACAATAEPSEALTPQTRVVAGGSRWSVAHALVVAQVALSVVLLVAAGLFIRTFAGLAMRPRGFDTDRVAIVNVNASRAHVETANRIPFYYQLTAAVRGVPGVAAAAGSVISPLSGGGLNNFVEVPGAPEMAEDDRMSLANFVTPDWFSTYRTPILAGRDVTEQDAKTAPPVTLVNEAFAHKYFPGRDPLGGTVRLYTGRQGEVQLPKTVVGVVADAVYRSLRDPATPTIYIPLAQWNMPFPMTGISIGVRSAVSGSPLQLSHAIGAALTAIDPDLAFNVRSFDEQVNASLTQERIVALLSAVFGGLALLLAGLGLYGVTSYAVSRRRTEIGIRVALGAAPGGVVRLVLTRVVMLVAAGTVIGAGISVWASTFVASLLYGLEPHDPITIAGAALILLTVGAAAGWQPAYRASRIDPAEVLRAS